MKASKRAAWDPAAALTALLSYYLNSTWTHELANNQKIGQRGQVRTHGLRYSGEINRMANLICMTGM